MASILQTLDELLQSLQQLKPPGVAKSKVDAITKVCTSSENLQIPRENIVATLVNAFKRSPPTHKLGIMYCADSVVRQWIAQGGANNAGVQNLTDNLPFLMDELLSTAPEAQKERISKLIDIWLGSKTFSPELLNSFKQRLNNAIPQILNGTQPQQIATPTNGQNYAQPAIATPSSVSVPNGVTAMLQQPFALQNPVAPVQAMAPSSIPPAPVAMNQYSQPVNTAVLPQQQPAAIAQNHAAVAQNGQPPALTNQLQILQQLVAMNPNITPEQLTQIIQTLGIQMPAMPSLGAALPQGMQPVAQAPVAPPPAQMYPSHGQDLQAYRDRSRSPDHKRRRVSPPNRRESPTYGVYDPSAASSDNSRGADRNQQGRGRGKGRDNYRKRTPPRERPASPGMLSRNGQGKPTGMPKPIGTDYNLPAGRIKVLSRTLFIGGVSSSTEENELMSYIARYAHVQSCIVNHDKRHAFLKLISHQDAILAKQAVDSRPETEYRHLFERMNWAVGFGPTQFADYKLGESVLPINVLTDADLKWLKTAEYGGTGGLDIVQGMVVEEPDIEIGAGPSSKAISRRGGHKSGFGRGQAREKGGDDGFRGGNRGGRGDRDERRERYEDHAQPRFRQERPQPPPMETHMPEPINIAPPPPVPTFGGAIPGFPYPGFR